MTEYAPDALRQVEDLHRHYEDRGRPEAILALDAALAQAERKIDSNPGAGLRAPRPYPHLARQGRAWIKTGRYWIAYTTVAPPVIVGVFYETSDIPSRL